MKYFFLFFFLFINLFNTYSQCTQGSTTTFQKVFGGAGNERAHSVQQTADGGYIIVGETTSFGAGNKDWFVMKTDANANSQWTKTYGGTFDDDGNSIIIKQTSDGGYVVIGYTTGFGAAGQDPYIIRMDNNGSVLWEKRITGAGNDYFRDIKETTSGNFIISGTSNSYGAGNSDFYLTKMDATGNLLWTKTYGGASTEHSTSVIDAGNSYYISGSAKSYGNGQDDALLIKTDTNGNIIWSRAYIANNIDYFYSTNILSDGNLIHTGGCNTFGSGGRDILVMKTDTSGNIIWQYVYGGVDEERGIDVFENIKGEIIVNAKTESFGSGNIDLLLLNLDNSGNLNWAKSYGAVNDDDFENWGSSLALCTDTGNIIVGGTFNYGAVGEDIYMVKTNQCGDSYCNESSESVIKSTASLVANNVTPSVSLGGTDVVTNSSISNISFSDNVLCADTVEISNPCTQGAATTFQKVFGGTGNERAHSVQQTADGGYIIVGETTSFGAGNKDWFVMKTDANANPQWTKTYGGTGSEDGLSITVEQTSDGGYVIVGETTSFGASGRDPYIIRIDNLGNILWEKVFPGSGNDYFRDVIETSSGDLMMVGCSNSIGAGSVDHLVVRLSSSGIFKWGKTYGSSNSDQSYSIIEYSNNEYYVNGHILAGGDYSGYVYKIDSLGTFVWGKTYDGGPGFEVMYATSKLQDGNLIHAGTTDSYGAAGRNFWIMKTNPLGNIIWSKAIGGNLEDRATKIMETPNGELVFSGISNSFGAGGNDFLVVNADSLGNVNFSNTFGGVNNDDMEYYGEIMDSCSDSGFIFVGGNQSISFGGEDIYIVKTNSCIESYCYTSNAPVISSNAPLVASSITPVVSNFNTPINSNSLVSNINFTDSVLCADTVEIVNPCTQGAATTFQKVFGGTGNERAHSVQQTADGGYIIVGETTSFGAGNKDWFVMKTDANANPQWTKTYGGTGDEDGQSITIKQTADMGYIVAGQTTSFGSSAIDPYVLRLDNTGNIVWEKRISGSGNDFFLDVIETQTGDFMFVGTTNSHSVGGISDVYVVKLSSIGGLLWTRSFGGNSVDHGAGIVQISNNSFLLVGTTISFGTGGRDGFISKIDGNGNLIWHNAYGSAGEDGWMKATVLSDNNILITGYSDSFGAGQKDVLVLKSDTAGNIIWSKVFGDTGEDRAVNSIENQDGDLLFSAVSNSFNTGSNDIIILKTDPLGNIDWSVKYGDINTDEIELWGYGVGISNDTSQIIVGGTNNFGAASEDIYIIKSNKCGDSFCNEAPVPMITTLPNLLVNSFVPAIGSGGSIFNTASAINNINFSANVLCMDSVSSNFQCNVTANFSTTQFCEGDSTLFSDLSIDSVGNIVNWQWYFGDGDSLIGIQNPSHLYNSSGNYNVTLSVTTDSNCTDSITIPITINPIFNLNRNDTICQGDSILLGGAFQNSAGVYTDSLQTILGCDSIINTNLTVNSVFSSTQNSTICQGDSLLFNGNYYFSTGIYTDSIQTTGGCDSLLTLNLTVNPIAQVNQSQSICQGDSVFLGGAFQNSAGVYTDSLQTVLGCDSLIITNLLVAPIYNDSVSTTICEGDSILLGGAFQTTAGTYVDNLQSIFGCDSMVTTNLTLNPVGVLIVSNDTTASPCEGVQLFVSGGSSYLWSPVDYLSCSTCFDPIASPPITTSYTVSDPSSSCTLPNSLTVYVDGDAQFFIPNVFTPNGDGSNDLFNVSSDCIYSLEKKIYNRWGQLLFQSSQINEGWNGRTTAGAEVPEGTYFYIIEVGYYVGGNETTETFTGYLTLLR